MYLEALLASVHLVAILTLVVFQSSQAALCRADWFNRAVLARLGRLDRIVTIAGIVVILSGIARLAWGVKGLAGYLGQPLFHWKMLVVALLIWLSWRASRTIRGWLRDHARTGTLPTPEDIRRARGRIMAAAHVVPVIAVVAVFWARGLPL